MTEGILKCKLIIIAVLSGKISHPFGTVFSKFSCKMNALSLAARHGGRVGDSQMVEN